MHAFQIQLQVRKINRGASVNEKVTHFHAQVTCSIIYLIWRENI